MLFQVSVNQTGLALGPALAMLADVTGFVPQDDILYGDLTVAENVRYAARLCYGL